MRYGALSWPGPSQACSTSCVVLGWNSKTNYARACRSAGSVRSSKSFRRRPAAPAVSSMVSSAFTRSSVESDVHVRNVACLFRWRQCCTDRRTAPGAGRVMPGGHEHLSRMSPRGWIGRQVATAAVDAKRCHTVPVTKTSGNLPPAIFDRLRHDQSPVGWMPMTPLKRSLLSAALLAFAACLPTSIGAQSSPRKLVILLAHADDETAAAPALARYAREGVQVYMLIATDGSGGSGTQAFLQRSDSGPVGDALVKARVEEARCAATALGAQEPVLLAFPDGKLGDYLGDRTLIARLTDRIAKEIERLHPDVVVTWGPDGGTGHPDHRLVGDIATQLQRAGVAGMPDRLAYMYLPAEMFRVVNPQRGAPPMVIPQEKYFTVRVPITDADLEAAGKALACHHSQFTAELLQRFLPAMPRLWNGAVRFIPGSPAVSGGDLFR